MLEPRAGFEPATCRFPADYKAAAFRCPGSGICQAEPPRRPGVILRMMLKILAYEVRPARYLVDASSSASMAGNFSPASIDIIAPPAVLTCENFAVIPSMLA